MEDTGMARIRQFRENIRNYRGEGRRGERGIAADATTWWSTVDAALPVRTILLHGIL